MAKETHEEKIFLSAVATLILASVHFADAQQPKKVARIGFLAPATRTGYQHHTDAFLQGLRELGYVEGQNIVIEYRWADGNFERLPELAAELVRLKVDVIVAAVTQASLAAKNATGTIPIVMVAVGNPVDSGLIASLARPGANITGTSCHERRGRWQTARAAQGNPSRRSPEWPPCGILPIPSSRLSSEERRRSRPGHWACSFTSWRREVPTRSSRAFAAMAKERTQGTPRPKRSGVHLSPKTDRRPCSQATPPDRMRDKRVRGGWLPHGLRAELSRHRTGAPPTYVDKILKGTKPADIPVEQADEV